MSDVKKHTLSIKQETKLKAYMRLKGMSRDDLFQKILEKYPNAPINRSQISQIMNGQKKNFNLFTLYRLMNATGLTPNDLLNWEEHTK